MDVLYNGKNPTTLQEKKKDSGIILKHCFLSSDYLCAEADSYSKRSQVSNMLLVPAGF